MTSQMKQKNQKNQKKMKMKSIERIKRTRRIKKIKIRIRHQESQMIRLYSVTASDALLQHFYEPLYSALQLSSPSGSKLMFTYLGLSSRPGVITSTASTTNCFLGFTVRKLSTICLILLISPMMMLISPRMLLISPRILLISLPLESFNRFIRAAYRRQNYDSKLMHRLFFFAISPLEMECAMVLDLW